jgi:DNA-binding response OmpR family regulator
MKRNVRIFLCDDDELIVSMLSRTLKKDGHEVMVKRNSDNALAEIATWQPDVVLLDIHLDEHKSGLDILKEIKAERLDPRVIMITADDRAESVHTAWQFGASKYLTKPFDVEELKAAIRETGADC